MTTPSPLEDIPFVMSLATRIWGDDDDGDGGAEKAVVVDGEDDGGADPDAFVMSPEACLRGLPLNMHPDCWMQVFVKVLGVSIIAFSCLNKAPIMANLMKNRSSAGLSRNALYGETVLCLNCMLYGIVEKMPITAYGENFALTIQCAIIVVMIWQLAERKRTESTPDDAVVVTIRERFVMTASAGLYAAFCLAALPEQFHYLLMASLWPVLIMSRGSQIIETFQTGHTGSQSVLTSLMNLAGSGARIFTTIQEVGLDFAVLTGYFLSVFLNGIMVLQYFYYQKNTEKFLRDLQEKAKKKKE